MSGYRKILAQNKRANFEYSIEEKFEAGIVLLGSEVKSLRVGKCNIVDSHASTDKSELFLYNSHIGEYKEANRLNHDPKRPRKLLLRKPEIKRIIGKILIKGYTLIVLSLYFNEKNKIKLELALAKGKKLHDKRHSIKEKDWQREQGRIVRDK